MSLGVFFSVIILLWFFCNRKAFTLIELLVVIAIIAILSIVVILTLNPAALLQQSRDSNRLSDMADLTNALGIYTAQGGTSMGNTNTVYISISDPTATSTAGDQCQGLGLISLPASYSYHCPASSTLRYINGTGWIPINFTTLAAGSPLSQLPIDPLNTSSSREYYTYTTNGSQYEVTMVPESAKYQLGGSNDVISSDGGTLASVYEKGSFLGLEPLDYGDNTLVGYWTLNEGTGTVAYDYSGNNATGSWSGTQAGTNGYYSAGKIGSWAGYLNAVNDNLVIPNGANRLLPTSNQPFSVVLWVNANILTGLTGNSEAIMTNETYAVSGFRLAIQGCNSSCYFTFWSSESGGTFYTTGTTLPLINTWYLITATYDGITARIYVNGSLQGTGAGTYIGNTNSLGMGASYSFGKSGWSGLIDDLRIYNRALTAAQVAAMYAGGK